MRHGSIPWPPRVGDTVRLKDTGRVGRVVAIEGNSSDRRFVLDIHSDASHSALTTLKNTAETFATRRFYALNELAPSS